jgi:hypothetical protein
VKTRSSPSQRQLRMRYTEMRTQGHVASRRVPAPASCGWRSPIPSAAAWGYARTACETGPAGPAPASVGVSFCGAAPLVNSSGRSRARCCCVDGGGDFWRSATKRRESRVRKAMMDGVWCQCDASDALMMIGMWMCGSCCLSAKIY